jgi:tetratricopeptide (TPR) repeat protein
VPYGNLGFVYLQQGEVDAAIEFLQKAVSINPQFIQALATLASAYFMQGNLDESIQTSKRVLEMAPTFAVAHNNLALAYFEKGEFQSAVVHCDQAQAYSYSVNPRFLEELEPFREGPKSS